MSLNADLYCRICKLLIDNNNQDQEEFKLHLLTHSRQELESEGYHI